MNIYKSSVGKWFLLFSVVPIIIICSVLGRFSSDAIYKVKLNSTRQSLEGCAKELVYTYELLSDDGVGIRKVNGEFYSGTTKITGDYSILDRMKEQTGVEFSLFYMDTRILTTIMGTDGNRYINTKAREVWSNYVQFGEIYFDDNIPVDDKAYFGCYVPIHSSENVIVGMGFAGVLRDDILTTISKTRFNIVLIGILLSVCFILISILVTRRILQVLNTIMSYLREIDEGNFDHTIDEKVVKRQDEYGSMSRTLIKLNDSLQALVLRDGLTDLYNRRAAMKYLEQYMAFANRVDGMPFTFVIGDIDFFKKVNDTYGHNCGDVVLKMVAGIINEIDDDKGFVARWGGEEFVMALRCEKDEALKIVEDIAQKIKSRVVEYDGKLVSVTMTFGLSQYKAPEKLDILISRADRLLYKGKEEGRDRIKY